MASDDFQERLRRIQTQNLAEGQSLPEEEFEEPPRTYNPAATLLAALLSLPIGIALGVLTGLYAQAAMEVGQSLLITLMLALIYLMALAGLMAGYLWRENMPLVFPACLIGLIGAAFGTAGVLVLYPCLCHRGV